jgi:ribosomal protein L21E
MDRIACDIMGPVQMSTDGYSYIMVVGDYFTKYTEAYPLKEISAQTCADILCTQWFVRFGCPLALHTDQGRNFEANLFKEICQLWDIQKTRTARYRPNSDGQIERYNRSLKKMLKSVIDDNHEGWPDFLPYVQQAYNASIHESTKCSPNRMLFNTENRLPVDIIYADCAMEEVVPQCPCEYTEWVRDASRECFSKAREHLKRAAERQKTIYDRNTCMREFKIGDWVWVFFPPELQNKFGRAWKGPYLVVKKLGEVNYVVQESSKARRITLHVDHMKLYISDDTPVSWVHSESHRTNAAVQTD